VLVSSRFYDSLPADLQVLLKTSGATLSQRLIADTRRDDQKSLAILASSTQPMQGWEKANFSALRTMSRKTVASLESSQYLSAELNQRVDAALVSWRSGKP
jgi:TRAP-type transport system periplasmic protein